jgi:hypothetical protein
MIGAMTTLETAYLSSLRFVFFMPFVDISTKHTKDMKRKIFAARQDF